MTPTIALIAVSLIAVGLCVAVGIMQWRISALKAQNDRERAFKEKAIDERDHALKEAKNEYDLRRQAERNLADANDEVDTWRARAMRAENALDAVKVTRDPKTGRMVSTKAKPNSPTLIETDGLTAKVVLQHCPTADDMAKRMITDASNAPDVIKRGDDVNEVKIFAVNRDGKACDVYVNGKPIDSDKTAKPKPHTLRHGMTVKDPTPEQAKQIFDEAKRLGIEVKREKMDDIHRWIWYYGPEKLISACADVRNSADIYLSPSQFLAHMRGEDVETLCEEIRHNANEGI